MVVRIFIGGVQALPPGDVLTGMVKREQREPLWLGSEGFAGDAQADRRVHGGPEKAVHLYPADHYPRLAAAFPAIADLLQPGALGENLSVAGLAEGDVCLDDVFALGEARLQVSRPRSPCWKIDRRLGSDGVMAHMAAMGLIGWYFRVLAPGRVAPGERLLAVSRAPAAITVAEAWRRKQAGR